MTIVSILDPAFNAERGPARSIAHSHECGNVLVHIQPNTRAASARNAAPDRGNTSPIFLAAQNSVSQLQPLRRPALMDTSARRRPTEKVGVGVEGVVK